MTKSKVVIPSSAGIASFQDLSGNQVNIRLADIYLETTGTEWYAYNKYQAASWSIAQEDYNRLLGELSNT